MRSELTHTSFESSELLTKMVQQLNRDFYLCGLDTVFHLVTTFSDLESQLLKEIQYLLDTAISDLYRLLYRIDVSENRLRDIRESETNLTETIVSLILKRTRDKIYWRSQFD